MSFKVKAVVMSKKKHHLPISSKSGSSLMFQVLIVLGILNMGGILSILWFDSTQSRGSSLDDFVPFFLSAGEEQFGVAGTLRRLKLVNIDVDPEDEVYIPPWKWIERQYGPEPVILGLERCHTFRSAIANNTTATKIVAPAGMFNSGTNLLYHLMERNCIFDDSIQVAFSTPWGKHTPAEHRKDHTIPNNSYYEDMDYHQVLPVVLIRHPMDWILSTCEQPYYAKWPRHKKRDCPALVEPSIHHKTKSINVVYGHGNETYESGIHWWNEWNRAYFDSLEYPRLMVRLEDLLFHPQHVLRDVCSCAGGTVMANVSIPIDSVKSQGHYKDHTVGFLGNVVKYGTPRFWTQLFPNPDLVAARKHLDREMVETFQYRDVYEELSP